MGKVVINTTCGLLQGEETLDAMMFYGVRYARAGRYESPVLVSSWEGVYDATQYGPACPQYNAFYEENTDGPISQFYADRCKKKFSLSYSEDCLNLNLWIPKNVQAAPVLLYFHGGGYNTGCNTMAVVDGIEYNRRGIILVTANYRLNAFCSAVDKTHGGNYGLQDQIAALQWVYQNIASFGGDPKHIVIAGESAGAFSVQNLTYAPQAADLFSGAIMMSGGGIMKGHFEILENTLAKELWKKILQDLGEISVGDLQELPAKEIFDVWRKETSSNLKYAFASTPVIDGITIPDQPERLLTFKKINDVPSIIGVLNRDMWPYDLYQNILNWGTEKARRDMQPVYGYYMDREIPSVGKGMYHGGDLWYGFGTLGNSTTPFEDVDRRISKEMIDTFAAFIKTGQPFCENGVIWEPVNEDQKQLLCFSEQGTYMCAPPENDMLVFQKKNKPFPGM